MGKFEKISLFLLFPANVMYTIAASTHFWFELPGVAWYGLFYAKFCDLLDECHYVPAFFTNEPGFYHLLQLVCVSAWVCLAMSFYMLISDSMDSRIPRILRKNRNYAIAFLCFASGNSSPCTLDATYHYSQEYAQQMHYPHHCQQVSPIYFKVPRKCHVFGVCAEGSGKQKFYLINESQCTGTGTEDVTAIALLPLFEILWHRRETCSGIEIQNKNKVVVWYAVWRALIAFAMSGGLYLFYYIINEFPRDVDKYPEMKWASMFASLACGLEFLAGLLLLHAS